jgi:PAS domain S-box-containing protein
MKRYIVPLLCLSLLSAAVFGAPVAADDSITVRVGVYENNPKIFTDENGDAAGFWPDIIEYIAAEEGWSIEYVPGSWTQCLNRLANNEIDVMPDVAYTEGRATLYDFSNETVYVSWSRVYTREGVGIDSILDLEGKNIGVLRGSINFEGPDGIKVLVNEFDINCTFIEVDSYTRVFELVESGEADAGVASKDFGYKHEAEFNVVETAIIFQPSSLCFAFPQDSSLTPYLVERIDSCVKELKEDKDSIYYQALTAWFGTEPAEKPVIPAWLRWILIGIGGLAILFGGGYLILSSRVRARTKALTEEIGQRKEAEKALRKSEKQYRTTLDNMLEGCQIIDRKWRYAYLNGAAAKHGRRPKEELIGHTMMEAYPGIEQTEMFKHLKHCMEKRVSHRMENEFIYPDDSRGWFELSMEPMAEGVFILSIDITERKEAEETLRKSQASLAEAQRVAHIGSWELDLASNELSWSDEVYRIFGLKPQKFGATYEAFLENIHPDDREMVNKAYTDSLENKTPYSIVHRLLLKDGTLKYVEERCETSYDNEGKPVRSLGTVMDVTERKRAEEALRASEYYLRKSQQIAHFGSWVLDVKTNRVEFSDEMFNIFGINKKQFTGTLEYTQNLVIPEDLARVQKIYENLLIRHKPVSMEYSIIRPDGSLRHLWGNGEVELDEKGNLQRLVGTVLDITERKKAEETLKKWSEELEKRVQQRTAELEQRSQELAEANVNLEEMSRHKSQFLANMSHELRTPLNSIIGYTKFMLDGLEGEINEEQRQDLQTVYNNSQSLLTLINDLLDLSKIEAGRVTVTNEAFTIAELLDEVMPSIRRLAEGKGLALEYSVAPDIDHIYADRAKTKQTLVNLLGNAIKFTSQGSVKLDVTEGDGEFIFSVSDTGMGIKKEDLEVIFDSFTQVGPAQIAGFEGTGLGLAISKQFVEMQGGRIWAESELNEGSTFTFTLPKKKAPSP